MSGDTATSSDIDEWMAERIRGNSFMDVGGLLGSTGEKITFAHRHGARHLVMVDHVPLTDPLWTAFVERLKECDPVPYVHTFSADVEDMDFQNDIGGASDFVYCNGLFYHSANPIHFLQQLASVTRKHLVLGSIHSGRCGTQVGESIFIPNNRYAATIVDRLNFPADQPGYGISVPETEWFKDGRPNARPFWWLHSKDTIQRMLKLVGFSVDAVADEWDGRVTKLLCVKDEHGQHWTSRDLAPRRPATSGNVEASHALCRGRRRTR